MKFIFATILLLFIAGTNTLAQEKSSAKNWTGKWRGTLTNTPARPGSVRVEVTREIEGIPAADNTCTKFRTTYTENSVVKGVKDYRLCRGTGADDLFIDEGHGIKLTARWIGDVLVSPFKYDNILLISSMRLRGDVLEEEILSVEDKPAIKGVQPLLPRSIQRLELKRVQD
jgi:hypothetical protein